MRVLMWTECELNVNWMWIECELNDIQHAYFKYFSKTYECHILFNYFPNRFCSKQLDFEFGS